MKLPLFGLLVALVAAASCEKICQVAEHELKVPEIVDCEKLTSFISAKAENFRWPQIPSFPWITLPPRWPPFFPPNFPNIPNWTRRPPRPTPPTDDDSDEKEREECPDEGIAQISHPDSCEKYILCINGNEFERSCHPGFHFSRKDSSCMPKREAGCEDFEHVWECPEKDNPDNLVFLPNTENCSKYYLCFNGQQIPFECTDGLHWSIEEDNCLPKADANCEFEDGEEDDYEECPESGIKSISHPSSCEKYILCVGGNPFERQCGPGLHFSRDLRNCVAAEDAGCKERPMSCPEEDDLGNLVFLPNKEDCSMYYVCFGGEAMPLSCAKGLHWSVAEEACLDKADAECEDSGDDYEECPESGIKSISHPSNCEKYILCVGGNPFERQCGPGLHFSRDVRACVHPDDAGCEARELSCPEEDDLDNLKFLPNKKDCSMYYVCFGGEPFPLSCPDGLHWSVEAANCVDKAEAGCEDPDNYEECPESGIKSISHPSNCEKYILCVGGNPFPRQCGPGLHFSREHRTCVLPEDAGCEDADEYEQCPDEGIEQIAHPDNCEKFVLCVGGVRHKRNCGPGLHFSPTLRVCVQPDVAECEVSEHKCPDTDDLGNLVFIPHEDNCSKYYLCFGGDQILLTCSEGLHWNNDEERCMLPSEAGCDDEAYEQCPEDGIEQITHPSECSMYVLCVGGTRIKRSCAPGFHFSREFRTCLPIAIADCEDEDGEEEGFVCPKEDDLNNLIFLHSEESCEQYYICHRGAQVPFRCGNGLHWSRKNENCMLPEDAGCALQTFDFDCPESTGLQFYVNPSDCASYIACREGRAQKEVCPSGFFWNRNLEICTFAYLVDCP